MAKQSSRPLLPASADSLNQPPGETAGSALVSELNAAVSAFKDLRTRRAAIGDHAPGVETVDAVLGRCRARVEAAEAAIATSMDLDPDLLHAKAALLERCNTRPLPKGVRVALARSTADILRRLAGSTADGRPGSDTTASPSNRGHD